MVKNSKNNSITRLIIVALIVASSCLAMQAQRIVTSENKRSTVVDQMVNAPIHNRQAKVDQLLSYAFSFKGTPYVHGAMSPKGFDCSGFTSYVFGNFGYSLSRTSGDQKSNGRSVNRNELKPGDLVFFNGRARGNRIGHVGIVTEADNSNGTFKFIHAASRGVRESHSTESYYVVRYMGACRVIE